MVKIQIPLFFIFIRLLLFFWHKFCTCKGGYFGSTTQIDIHNLKDITLNLRFCHKFLIREEDFDLKNTSKYISMLRVRVRLN